MSFWIPDPRFEMPELLIPKEKPNGKAVLDNSSKVLSNADIPSSLSAGMGIYVAYPDTYTDVLANANNLSVETIPTFVGGALRFDGPAEHYYRQVDKDVINTRPTFTIVIDATVVGGAGTNRFLGGLNQNDGVASYSGTFDRTLTLTTSNTIRGYIYDGSLEQAISTDTYAVGDRIIACFTVDATRSNSMEVVVNGKLVATNTTASNNGFNGYSTAYFHTGEGYISGTHSANSDIRMNGMFLGALTTAQAISFTNDPYQFLIPA